MRVAGLKLQVVSGGKPMQIDGERGKLPVKPFCAENASVVEADWPGFAMMIVAGLAATPNVPPTSIKVAEEVDPLKFASPLYWAVMLSSPSGI